MYEKALTFSDNQLTHITRYLRELVLQAKVEIVIVSDATGQVVACEGAARERDATALSVLVTGAFAANAEIARSLGRDGRFQQNFLEGESYNIYSAAIGDEFLLTVTFDAKAVLGLVRILVRQVVKDIQAIVAEAEAMNLNDDASGTIDKAFGQALADELDQVFGDLGDF